MIAKSKFAWGWLGLLLIVDIAVPWYMLSGQARFNGAFLFWVIWTLVAIVSMFMLFKGWQE